MVTYPTECPGSANTGSWHHRHCSSNPTAFWQIAMPVVGAVHCIKSGHFGPHNPSKIASCRDCDYESTAGRQVDTCGGRNGAKMGSEATFNGDYRRRYAV